ncbi:type II toxin-antitoxin system HicB family antitoxin [Alkalihalobacterium elongatum]|uniref:type II toxin-antitoxin system HicB family antitoxin n=1 Tax=Alkalihalobacterium elongatum TaxID=2675466 RepID=UPI001C1FEA78|nr:type II toxin-antitoxin system HicB family antitoxin [Alkalihalobacterium elongatum]
MKRGHQEIHNILDLKQHSLILRRQYNWKGQEEYSVEIKGLEDCVGYGDTYKEAKEDLILAVRLWLKREGRTELPPINKNKQPMLFIEPSMTEEEFKQINVVIKEWNE